MYNYPNIIEKLCKSFKVCKYPGGFLDVLMTMTGGTAYGKINICLGLGAVS